MSLSVRLAPLARFGVWLPALAWALALALTAWIAAIWYWRVAAPRPEQSVYAAQTDPAAAAREIATRHVFGAPAQVASEAPPPSQFQLLGVAANSGPSRGFAILQIVGQQPMPVIQGEELAPGVRLEKILPQSVELSIGGVRQTVPLSQSSAVPPAPLPGNALRPMVQPTPAQPMPGIAPAPAAAPPATGAPAAQAPNNDESEN
ncbi:MAG: type II secretion system protein N [Rhodocyclaceae bacterium]